MWLSEWWQGKHRWIALFIMGIYWSKWNKIGASLCQSPWGLRMARCSAYFFHTSPLTKVECHAPTWCCANWLKWQMLLTCFWEVPGLNLAQNLDYPDCGFSQSLWVDAEKSPLNRSLLIPLQCFEVYQTRLSSCLLNVTILPYNLKLNNYCSWYNVIT
jgi:hypothetical protein